MQNVAVFKNLSSPLILGIDAIENFGILYLLITISFIFQDNLDPKELSKGQFKNDQHPEYPSPYRTPG
jgi:hypothetical protein